METSASLLEAQQIIDEWLKEDTEVVKYGDVNAPSTVLAQNRVKTTRSRDKRSKTCDLDNLLVSHTNWNGDSENTDYITGMDFVDTDISDCVQQVMAGMYTQPLECDVVKMIESQQATSNPAITMEMRHKQVKSRRQHREHYRSILLKAQAAEKEQRLAAERRVKSEQEAVKMKQKQEEALVRLEMVKIRKQLKEKREREKLLHELNETLGNGTRASNQITSPPHGVLSTAKQVMDEELHYRMVAETRRVLVKQLAEAELLEVKENSKLLRRCFNTWLDVVYNAKLIKERACAMWMWQTKCRVFRSWRRLVEQNKRQQELATLALQLQWEKRCLEMATLHHNHALVAKVFTSWKQWLRGRRETRSREQMRQRQQHKMAALLARVTSACWYDPSTAGDDCKDDPPTSQRDHKHDSSTVECHRDHSKECYSTCNHHPTTLGKECHSVCHHDPTTLGKKCHSSCHHDPTTLGKKQQPVHHPTVRKEDTSVTLITSKLVRQELEKLLAEKSVAKSQDTVAPDHMIPIISDHVSPVASDHMSHAKFASAPVTASEPALKQQPNKTLKKQLVTANHRPLPLNQQHKTSTIAKQPPTKPLPLLGMERRTHMMAKRRQARMERQRQREEQLLVAKQQEQQEREEATLAAKEALIRKKREERQLAKQKEIEKQRHLEELQQKITIATNHYNNWLLKYRGILPWQQFITRIREDDKIAAQFHVHSVSKTVFLTWKQHFEYKCEQRNKKADQFYITMVTRRSLTVWKKYVMDMKKADRQAEQWHRWLIVQRYFRGWHTYVRQQEIKLWEKERRAKVHYQWSLKRKTLLAWHHHIPAAKEERSREQRRDVLRKKVAMWLPDYQTAINSED